MTTGSRLAASLAAAVTLASLTLVVAATSGDATVADSRLISLGWVLVPAVGTAAYLRLRWGLLAAAGALAPPLLATVPGPGSPALSAAAAAVLALAVLVGHLARLAEQREDG